MREQYTDYFLMLNLFCLIAIFTSSYDIMLSNIKVYTELTQGQLLQKINKNKDKNPTAATSNLICY